MKFVDGLTNVACSWNYKHESAQINQDQIRAGTTSAERPTAHGHERRSLQAIPAPGQGGTFPAGVVVCSTSVNHIPAMCGRVIQSSAPITYAIVDGMNVRDSRVHNYPLGGMARRARTCW